MEQYRASARECIIAVNRKNKKTHVLQKKNINHHASPNIINNQKRLVAFEDVTKILMLY